LTSKFGDLSEDTLTKLRAMQAEQLQRLSKEILTASNLEELELGR